MRNVGAGLDPHFSFDWGMGVIKRHKSASFPSPSHDPTTVAPFVCVCVCVLSQQTQRRLVTGIHMVVCGSCSTFDPSSVLN